MDHIQIDKNRNYGTARKNNLKHEGNHSKKTDNKIPLHYFSKHLDCINAQIRDC